jgi:hypothetical protein
MPTHLTRNLPSRIGCHCWGDIPASTEGLTYAAQAGCRWVRSTRPMQMDYVAVGPGRYDFAGRGEASVNRALDLGLSVMGILDARWGNETGCNVLGFCSPVWEHLDVWADFVAQAVAFYRDRVKYWEIINEPPFFWWYPTPPGVRMPDNHPDLRRAPIARYADLLHASAAAIRATDPEAQIVAGAGFPDAAFLRRLYALGCKDDFDIASVHYLNCKHPADFSRGMRTLRAAMAEAGDAEKPIWDTENGPNGAVIGHAVETPEAYEGLTAIYRHCFAHEFDLARYFWFTDFRADALADAPQPGAQAMQVLTALLGDGGLRAARHIDDEVHLYVFDGNDGPVSVLWSTAPATASLPGGCADAQDHLGAPCKLASEFELTGCPLYLPGDISRTLEAHVTGGRTAIVTPMKQPPDGAPTMEASPAPVAFNWADEHAWSRIPHLARRDEIPVVTAGDHFSCVMSSTGAEVQLTVDPDALYLRVRTYDDALDLHTPTGLVQLSLRDSDPEVSEWGYFTNAWALFSLYLSREQGPMVLRYEHLLVDQYPAGHVPAAQLLVDVEAAGLIYRARLPWTAIGPCRPGRHNPFLLMMTFNRADALLELPAGDEPWEWSHNFVDNFIVKTPALTRWVVFP